MSCLLQRTPRSALPDPHSALASDRSVLSTKYRFPTTHHSPRPFFATATLTLLLTHAALAQQPTGRLPWESPPRVSEPILRLPSGPAEIFERFDIGASQLDHFTSGQPLSPAEQDVLAKILFSLPRLGLENIERWRQPADWDRLAAAPADHRLQVFRLQGRAARVTRHALLPEQAELYEFAHYYWVTLTLTDAPYQALIAARAVPASWALDVPIDEPAAADGLFVKVANAMSEPPELIFAANRVAWFPVRSDPARHIGPAQLALAKIGLDHGLWDDVRAANDRALTAADREAFYQLLAALGRPAAAQLRAQGTAPLDIVPLLERPADHHGEILPVQGIARRVLRVPVSDPDINSRFGIDHYYEIDLFLPLAGANLRLGNDPTGEKSPVFRNTFPATLIVRQLPTGLTTGENLHALIRADAVFFKTWAYRSPFTAKFGQLQPAPLFMATQLRLLKIENATNWLTGAIVTGAMLLALGVVALILFFNSRTDRKSRPRIGPAKSHTLDLKF